MALILIALGCAAGYHSLREEANTRTNQFCSLVVARHNDMVDRYHQSVHYLNTAAGREKSGINDAVKESLPNLKRAVLVETKRVPKVCTQKFTVKTL